MHCNPRRLRQDDPKFKARMEYTELQASLTS